MKLIGKRQIYPLILALFLVLQLFGCGSLGANSNDWASINETVLEQIPEADNKAYVLVNNNQPQFTEDEIANAALSYESYSPLDKLGRCGTAMASVGQDIMPTEKRDSISQVKPTGWQSVSYDFITGKSLYNRCHLIGYQLSGENANERNLITGTRYMNEAMIDFETQVADYVKETDHHVLYRVTPVFEGDNLVATGLHMEGYSVEDEGASVCFNVYFYNIQPGVVIDYSDGSNYAEDRENQGSNSSVGADVQGTYVLNTKSKNSTIQPVMALEI